MNLTDADGSVVKTYEYDAFGVEKNPDDSDTNPFRYCGEYWDSETETYYLRARNYDPNLGRFTSEDIHWNVSNMIYGDNPQKINEREDKLGLKTYSYAPSISAIVQSSNLYAYCISNPVCYVDRTGRFWEALIDAAADHLLELLFMGFATCGIVAYTETLPAQSLESTTTIFPNPHADAVTKIIDRYAAGAESGVSELVDDTVERYDDKSPRTHHIVAQADHRAEYARNILRNAGIDKHDPINLVVIPQEKHKSLHTNLYYEFINDQMSLAVEGYTPDKPEYHEKVRGKLFELQAIILAYCSTGVIPW